MSQLRKIKRRIANQNGKLNLLEALGKMPDTTSVTMALAGNGYSGARRRMTQQLAAGIKEPLPVKVPVRVVPEGMDRTEARKQAREAEMGGSES